MSDLRRGLNDWAADHGTHVAEHLRHGDSESRVRGQAARRRRTRALGSATVAVVAVVGVAWAATALPFTEAPDFTPAAQVTLELSQVPDALSCGQPWTLEQGETQHGTEDGGTVRGEWQVTADNGTIERDPQELWVGFEALEWYQRSEGAPVEAAMMVTVLTAVKDGVIVGVNPAGGASIEQGDDQGATDFNQWAPLPGACGAETRVAEDGTYDFHVVQQLQDENGQPIATWVDPAGPITLEVTGLTDTSTAQPGPDPQPLVEPTGTTYQAFAMLPLAEPSCTPLADQLAQEPPNEHGLWYPVTIPGVQPLTGAIWGNAPVAIIDDPEFEAWYIGLPAAVTAEHNSAGDPMVAVDWEWITDPEGAEPPVPGTVQLLSHPSAVGLERLTGNLQCDFVQPIPRIEGGVWLVIDGVDGQALGEAHPTEDFSTEGMITWVYLGQAQ